MAREIPSTWAPSNGKFDDGIADIVPEPGAKAPTRGPRFRELLALYGRTEEQVDYKNCSVCGVRFLLKKMNQIRCEPCDEELRQQRRAERQAARLAAEAEQEADSE